MVLNANLDRALKEHLTLKYFNRLSGKKLQQEFTFSQVCLYQYVLIVSSPHGK